MKSLYHFVRLTRPMNLLVIALTMGVIRYYLNDHVSDLLDADYLLLVVSTLLIAAAGNIINDYFDVKADRVNKPEQMIIDIHIRRRVAILWNWIFNTAGFLIAAYLAWKYANLYIVLISFVSINVLWFYSMYFKRTFLLGNLFVAFLTGIVPLYVLVFDPQHHVFESQMIWFFSGYAFLLNFIREIVKDVADIKGDLVLHSKTIPIVFGIKKTRYMLFALYGIAIIPMLIFLYLSYPFWTHSLSEGHPNFFAALFLFLSTVMIICSMFFLPAFPNRSKYLVSSNLLKLAMFFGLVTPLFFT